jgi:hypothetical protein
MSRILLILFFFPSLVFAYQIAYIKESRALIYADHELKVPIGYLSKGKKIRVGEVKRNGGQALPLILSGKIVYIKVNDLVLKDQKKEEYVATETQHIIEEEENKEELLEPFRLVANLGLMNPGSQWDELMSLTGGSSSPMLQIEALVELRLIKSAFFFDAGLIYSTLNGGTYSYEGIGFKGLAQYRLLNLELFYFDVNAGFHFAPGGAKVMYQGVYDNGSYYGWVFGAQARFLPKNTWNLNLGVNYNIIGLQDIENIPIPSGEYKLNVFEGLGLYFGVSFPL